MDTFYDERDLKALEQDRYTFAVMRRVIKGESRLLLTDHERMILLHTGDPYPVWVWLPDDATPEEMEKAWLLIEKHCPPESGLSYNVKYDFANYMMARARENGRELVIDMNMLAYDCPKANAPDTPTDGALHIGTMEDFDDLVGFLDAFHKEVALYQLTQKEYEDGARNILENERIYFWKDQNGRIVACCKCVPDGNLASINLVFTRKECRRRHYAEHVVYAATQQALDDGFLPMLYTNADYIASNACYEKIGYVSRGKLCTIVLKKETV